MTITLRKPITLTDEFGFYLDTAALKNLKVGDTVRIGVKIDGAVNDEDFYARDTPYVEILKFHEKAGVREICGQITDRNRNEADIKYPIRCGERIWFTEEYIFEVVVDESSRFVEFVQEEHVLATGGNYAFSDSESDSESGSDD